MPNIKPVSDLRNYNEVLRDVAVGEPVFLTKNGRGRYALVDILDYEKAQATIKLMSELAKGQKSGEEKGWLSHEAAKAHFKEKNNEFDEGFISLARSVYYHNDERSRIKREINVKYGSSIVEEKSYEKYE